MNIKRENRKNLIVRGVGADGDNEHEINKVNELLQVLNLDKDKLLKFKGE